MMGRNRLDGLTGQLISADHRKRGSAYLELQTAILNGDLAESDLAGLAEALAPTLAGKKSNFNALRLLVVLAEKGIDISAAVPALEARMGRPADQGGREDTVRALNAHYVNTGVETVPQPMEEHRKCRGWKLVSVSRRSYYSVPPAAPEEQKKSGWPCSVCGSLKTVSTHAHKSHMGTNISGGTWELEEVLCLDCRVYSVYDECDTWGPSG